MNDKKKYNDGTYPCLTPDVISNHSVSSAEVLTALLLFIYISLMLLSNCPFTPYSSRIWIWFYTVKYFSLVYDDKKQVFVVSDGQ